MTAILNHYPARDGTSLVLGDSREILPELLPKLEGESIVFITDPVWPDCKVPLPGWENPKQLLSDVLDICGPYIKRLAIHLGGDSDPRFLVAVPENIKFFRNVTFTYSCPRKIDHVKWLVNWWTEPSDLIVDPFCGSATTLLAAQEFGRRSIGIEINEEFYEIAKTRLHEHQPPFIFSE